MTRHGGLPGGWPKPYPGSLFKFFESPALMPAFKFYEMPALMPAFKFYDSPALRLIAIDPAPFLKSFSSPVLESLTSLALRPTAGRSKGLFGPTESLVFTSWMNDLIADHPPLADVLAEAVEAVASEDQRVEWAELTITGRHLMIASAIVAILLLALIRQDRPDWADQLEGAMTILSLCLAVYYGRSS